MDHGGVSRANEASPIIEDPTPNRKKNPRWTTDQNLVLLGGWIKYGTDSVVGKNQKSEMFLGKIVDYYNEHCSFHPPCDGSSCRNHYNYINKILGKWVGVYERAKCMEQSGWSENDVLAKAKELYSSDTCSKFNLMLEWQAICDQPRYGNIESGSSGSKRARESDACDSNSVGSSIRPM